MATEQVVTNAVTAAPRLALAPGLRNVLGTGAQIAAANPLGTALVGVGAINAGVSVGQMFAQRRAERRRQASLDAEIARQKNLLKAGGLSRGQRRALNASANATARSNARTLKSQEVSMMNALGSEAGVGNAAVISANAGQARVNANLDMQAQLAAEKAKMVSNREQLVRDLFAEKRSAAYSNVQTQINQSNALKPSGANIYPVAAELQDTVKPPAPTTVWKRKSLGRSGRV